MTVRSFTKVILSNDKIRYGLLSIISLISYKISFGGHVIKKKGDFGFFKKRNSITKEENFLTTLDLSGKVIYDIGGYKGIFSIFFAIKSIPDGKVYVFEPNYKNYQILMENIRINHVKNVIAYNIGVGEKNYKTKMAVRKNNYATSSIDDKIAEQIIGEEGSEYFDVEIVTLDKYVTDKSLPYPQFVKIDVEGVEYDVLLGMRNILESCKPELFIEIHGIDNNDKLNNINNIYNLLNNYKYKLYHIETSQLINQTNIYLAREGHVYCQ